MTKDKWIQELKSGLKGLSKEEIDDIIADYNEYFYEAKENGRDEEDVTNALGDPKKLARQFKADSTIKRAQANMNLPNIIKAVFAIATLSVFNIVIMLGPITAIFGLIIGGFFTGVGIFGGGVLGFLGMLIFGSKAFVGLGISLSVTIAVLIGLCLGSLGILILIIDFWFGRWIFNLLVRYFKFNFDIVRKTAN